jgi:hypothetical protein
MPKVGRGFTRIGLWVGVILSAAIGAGVVVLLARWIDDDVALVLAILAGLAVVPIAVALVLALDRVVADKPSRPHAIWSFALLVVLALGFTVGSVATVVIAAQKLKLGDVFRPEIALPILLVASLIALVVALATLVAAFHLFDLKDKSKPFGVPEGTLQVVIALTLILIFAITSLYLRGAFDGGAVTIPGLTQTQVDQIQGEDILEKIVNEKDPTRFDVVRRVAADEDAKDFSTQLLTILGTLVGAVAGFYFGAKSVETGVKAGGDTQPPEITAGPRISGTPNVGESLRAEDGSWTGTPKPTLTRQWQRKKPTETDWTDIIGANASSYVVAEGDLGSLLRVAVIGSNSVGSLIAYSSETGVVLQAPVPPATRISILGTPRPREKLSVDQGKWLGTPDPKLTYQWERKKPDEIDWSPVPEATSDTYELTDDDAGHALRVVVTGSNAAGTVSASSPETAVVFRSPTAPSSGVSIVGDATVDSELSAVHEPWAGFPAPTLSYQWERRKSSADTWDPIEGAVGNRYKVREQDVNCTLRVVVTGSNAAGTAAVQSSETPSVQGTEQTNA